MSFTSFIIIFAIIGFVIYRIASGISFNEKRREYNQLMDAFLNSQEEISPEEALRMKNNVNGDIVGVYIIHNLTRDMYYVGQAKKIFFRLRQHFTGNGNYSVYLDYKRGDRFTIKIITLADSGYKDLDRLEKDLITKYDSYRRGYNQNSGNGQGSAFVDIIDFNNSKSKERKRIDISQNIKEQFYSSPVRINDAVKMLEEYSEYENLTDEERNYLKENLNLVRNVVFAIGDMQKNQLSRHIKYNDETKTWESEITNTYDIDFKLVAFDLEYGGHTLKITVDNWLRNTTQTVSWYLDLGTGEEALEKVKYYEMNCDIDSIVVQLCAEEKSKTASLVNEEETLLVFKNNENELRDPRNWEYYRNLAKQEYEQNYMQEFKMIEVDCFFLACDTLNYYEYDFNDETHNYWTLASRERLNKLKNDVYSSIETCKSLYGYNEVLRTINLVKTERPDIYYYLDIEKFKNMDFDLDKMAMIYPVNEVENTALNNKKDELTDPRSEEYYRNLVKQEHEPNILGDFRQIEMSCYDAADTILRYYAYDSHDKTHNYWTLASKEKLDSLRSYVCSEIGYVNAVRGYDEAIKLITLIKSARPDIYHYLNIEEYKNNELKHYE